MNELHERDDRADHDAAKHPEPSTEQRCDRHGEVRPARLPKMLQGGELEEAGDGHEDDGGEHRLREDAEKMRQEQDHEQDEAGRDCAGEGVRPAALVHERLGHATADGETAAKAGCEVRCGQSQELLVGIEASAMLGREGAADRSRLDGGQEEARQGEWQECVEIRPVDGRQAHGGSPCGTSPRSFTPR